MIGDGEWITIFAVAELELAFVIGAPERIRTHGSDARPHRAPSLPPQLQAAIVTCRRGKPF